MNVGQRVRQLRDDREWSQVDLSKESGLSLRTVQEIEYGRSNPTLETLEGLASAFGMSVAELLSDEPQEATG